MRCLFAILLCLAACRLAAQGYIAFPTDSARWNVVVLGNGCLHNELYGMDGDTLLDGTSYRKIYVLSQTADTVWRRESARYCCALREDSARRIWARWPDISGERLIYHFGLSQWDTARFYVRFFNQHFPAEVTYVDSVQAFGIWRRVWWMRFEGAPNTRWIEGIGSINGPFETDYIPTESPLLACFALGGQKRYQEAGFGACYCPPKASAMPDQPDPRISLQPNPLEGQARLQLSGITADSGAVFDMQGRRLLALPAPQDGGLLDFSELPPGNYVLLLYSKGQPAGWQRFMRN